MSENLETIVRKAQQTVEFKIYNFFSLRKSKFLFSNKFSFANDKWSLCIYPNGSEEQTSTGWISLYLYKEDSPNKPRVTSTIGIKKCDDSVFQSFDGINTFQKDWGWGYAKLVSRHELLQYRDVVAPNGALTVFCTMCLGDVEDRTLSAVDQVKLDQEEAVSQKPSPECIINDEEREDTSQFSSSSSDKHLAHHLKDLFLGGLHADVIVKVKGREFEAHKCVLAARSKVFAAMFEHVMVEKSSGIVDITGDANINPECVQDFFLFVYSGEMDRVSPDNAMDLYWLADKYDTEELKKACLKCLRSNLSVDSICDVIHFAMVHDESELLKTATEFFIAKSSVVLTTQKWRAFMLENPFIANGLFIKMANRNDAKN